MSLFSVQQNNDLRIRAQNIYGENFFIKDSPTDSWVPLKPGGDSPSAGLPYYIRPTEIEMDNGADRGLVIDPTGVTFGDDVGNKKIDATFVRNVEDLDTQVDANTTAVGNLVPRMTAVEGVNTAQGTSITAIQAKTANITQQGTSMLNLGFTSNISNRAAVTNSGLIVYNGTSAAASFPQVKVSPTYIHFFKTLDTSVFLDYDRVDNVAKLASVSTIDFNDKINFTKGITLPGAVESASTTNKKMVVLDATTKTLSYATIPSGSGATTKVLEHTPSLDSNLFKHSNYNSPTASSATFVGDINSVRKYDMDGVSCAVFDLKEAEAAFDVAASSSRTHVLTFFSNDANYIVVGGSITSEKLNLSISYTPSKNDLNSHLITVSLKPFPVVSNGQWAMSRMIMVERKESGVGPKPEVELRGKFIITNHVLTGYFGEFIYGWTE